MQLIDLKRHSRLKAANIIDRDYGGRTRFKEAVQKGGIGIGRLIYKGGLTPVDEYKEEGKFYKANLEVYKNGLGLYIYNVDDNFLILLDTDEVKKFRLYKPLDVIKPANFSFFTRMMGLGFDYYKCRFMLLEQEIVEYHPISLAIDLADGTVIETTIKRNSPKRHREFLQNNSLGITYQEDLHGHLLLDDH